MLWLLCGAKICGCDRLGLTEWRATGADRGIGGGGGGGEALFSPDWMVCAEKINRFAVCTAEGIEKEKH